MSRSRQPNERREFHCEHCGGQVLIPWDLPPTTGPCPHCAKPITSPAPGERMKLPGRRTAPKSNKSPLGMELSPSAAADDLASLDPPIKLDASQHAEPPVRQKKPAQPRKPNPTKPVLSRHPLAVDQSTGPVLSDFEKMLIEEAQRHKRRTLVMLTLLVLVVGSAAFLYLRYFPKAGPQAAEAPDLQEDGSRLSESYLRGAWEKEAREVLRPYLVATTTYGKVPHILGGHAMLKEMETFYKGAIINDLDTPVEDFTVKSLSPEDHRRGLFRMAYEATPGTLLPRKPEGGSDAKLLYPEEAAREATRIHAFFKHTPHGLKLDWNVFAQTKYRTLLHFARQPHPNRKATFRVLVAQDLPSPDQTATHRLRYRIADPANPKDVIWACAAEHSQAAKALDEIHWIGRENRKPVTRSATLDLAWTGDDDQRELVVHRFICWEFLGLGADAPSKPPSHD